MAKLSIVSFSIVIRRNQKAASDHAEDIFQGHRRQILIQVALHSPIVSRLLLHADLIFIWYQVLTIGDGDFNTIRVDIGEVLYKL